MRFWRLRYTHCEDIGCHDEYHTEEMFFENLEEAMSYVAESQSILDFTDIQLTKCNTVIYRKQYTLNDRKENNND